MRVLVPGHSDFAAVWYASRRRYDLLLKNGVEVCEWNGSMLHAKAVVVDRRWCSVGSYNLDHRSLLHNLEVNLHVLDDKVAGPLAQRLDDDISRSRRLTLGLWRKRPVVEKAAERVFYLFRYLF
ncbi:MAG: hypothetical protein HY748_05765 [Elusimicrobia bacterium]|nr:hypothetical protein [Elusimicrobiota bacterium]